MKINHDDMIKDMQAAAKDLAEEGYTCVLRKGGDRVFSYEHGIRPLLGWLEEGRDFSGYGAADRVVGRAAALLYARLGVQALYGRIISEQALPILDQQGVTYAYDTKVPFIINQRNDGMCPMEQAVWDVSDPEEAELRLKNKVRKMTQEDAG